MVRIRLSKNRFKNDLYYKIIVTDSRKSVNGKFIEKIGYFNKNSKYLFIKNDRILFWVKNGAKLSNRVKYLINNNNE